MAPPRLSQEVVDLIIDYLHDDPKSLTQCALVSTNWAPRARGHLFAEVTIPLRGDGRTDRSFERKEDIARHNSEIGDMVRRVCLKGSRMILVDPISESQGFSAVTSRLLCNVQHVAYAALLFPNTRELSISGFHCRSLNSVARDVLLAFPKLVTMSLDDIAIFGLPEPAPRDPINISASSALQCSTSLKNLTIRKLQASHNVLQSHSLALADSLARVGRLSSLVSLELLSAPDVSQMWLPFLRFIGTNLQHLAITINDVVSDSAGSNRGLTGQQLRDKIVQSYDALLFCRNLRSLCIRYDGSPTFVEAALQNSTIVPQTSPFFLEALSTLLSRADVPFPRLECLAFNIYYSTVESLAPCRQAWTALRGALCVRGRYPRFVQLKVELDEVGRNYGPWADRGDMQHRDPDVRVRLLAAELTAFTEAGVAVMVNIRGIDSVDDFML